MENLNLKLKAIGNTYFLCDFPVGTVVGVSFMNGTDIVVTTESNPIMLQKNSDEDWVNAPSWNMMCGRQLTIKI